MRLDAKWWPSVVVGALLVAGAMLRVRDVGGPWGYGIRDHEGALFHRFARNAIASRDWTLWLAPSDMITTHAELVDHYVNHPAVLVRLPRIRRESLRKLLGMAWRFVSSIGSRKSSNTKSTTDGRG